MFCQKGWMNSSAKLKATTRLIQEGTHGTPSYPSRRCNLIGSMNKNFPSSVSKREKIVFFFFRRNLLNQKKGDFASERFPSGQRGQTVNLLAMPSEVRILPSPPGQSAAHRLNHSSFTFSTFFDFSKMSGMSCLTASGTEVSRFTQDGRLFNLSKGKKRFRNPLSLFCKGGSSSVGRASAFQAEGRGFDPRFPLHFLGILLLIQVSIFLASLSC